MSRIICLQCQRPQSVCVCDWITPIANVVEVGVFQHPTEAMQVKGTAKLVALSLSQVQLWVGERLSDVPELEAWLDCAQQQHKTVLLLYPPTETSVETPSQPTQPLINIADLCGLTQAQLSQLCVLVLDGTWRKTHKMLCLNPRLAALTRLQIEPNTPSNYRIRKQKNAQSLSTVEAVVQVLSTLENAPQRYTPLLQAFNAMVQQQWQFRVR
ncbi:tRNA-uridine aminocarboxypropyltransferase [Thiomicrorhabdus aquaedulcis]|uniref:tRNA-uridine aminocarboxypropyltransferase n=1 Tax=Thiomicrorhabdus aquaedulcis TaxID=2211106 RepID=UPI000FDCB040|nr:tRNA-uridine aminocarboxypropyltransferase [Thiomicrorhabdus aquaedulcis]